MRFTLKQLEYFVAAGEALSIKQASERINISQPSISSAIAHLESDLGVQLFVRHHARGLSLTPAGRRLLAEAKSLLLQAATIYEVANETSSEVRGQLALGCFVTLAPMIMPELVHSFQSEYPGVRLQPEEGDHAELVARLQRAELDIVLTYDLPVPDGISFEALVALPPHVLVAADHRLAGRSSIGLQDLEGDPLILLDLPQSREYFLSIFHQEGVAPKIHARSRQQDVVRTMVANGHGFTLANVRPRNLTALDGRPLRQIPLDGDHRPMRIGIASLIQERKTRLLQTFETHCRALISDGAVPGMD
ncbi:MAG: LysR family transcriptional regulator [Pseudomonadota bacterium]